MQAISPKDFNELLREGKAIPFDIRNSGEFTEQHIPGAVMVPVSAIDDSLSMTVQGKEAVFYCTSGMRTELAAVQIDNSGIQGPKFLEGGLNAWSNEGLPTVGESKKSYALSLQRQVQITVGVILLLLAFASWAGAGWSPFAVAAIGIGLAFAGLSGTCGMARVLAIMPWNRQGT